MDQGHHHQDGTRRHVDDAAGAAKPIADGRLDPTPFATHRFELADTEEAYDTFADAASTNALKVVLSA